MSYRGIAAGGTCGTTWSAPVAGAITAKAAAHLTKPECSCAASQRSRTRPATTCFTSTWRASASRDGPSSCPSGKSGPVSQFPKGAASGACARTLGLGKEEASQSGLVDAAGQGNHLVAGLEDRGAIWKDGGTVADHHGDSAFGRQVDIAQRRADDRASRVNHSLDHLNVGVAQPKQRHQVGVRNFLFQHRKHDLRRIYGRIDAEHAEQPL